MIIFETLDQIIQSGNIYNILYCDAPWSYRNQKTGGTHTSGAAQKYATLSMFELLNFAPLLKQFTAKNAVMFMWATTPLKREALDLLNHWGFKYKTTIYWHKTGINGLGYWFRGEVEELLLGVKGNVEAFRFQFANHVEHPVLGHSEKPEMFRKIIEQSTHKMKDRKFLELFGTKVTEGWDVFGNDIKRLN